MLVHSLTVGESDKRWLEIKETTLAHGSTEPRPLRPITWPITTKGEGGHSPEGRPVLHIDAKVKLHVSMLSQNLNLCLE